MKNPLNLVIETLPGPLPRERLRCDQLTEREYTRQCLAEILEHGRLEAAMLRTEGLSCLSRAKDEVNRLLETARNDALQIAQTIQTRAVEDAVQWLCGELEMEQLIAREVSLRWRRLTAKALEELLGQQDQNILLLRRIERQVIELLPAGRVKLHLPPAAMAMAENNWNDIPEVTLLAEPSLSEGQAILDNGLVRIHLDNNAQQSYVLERFIGTAPPSRQHA